MHNFWYIYLNSPHAEALDVNQSPPANLCTNGTKYCSRACGVCWAATARREATALSRTTVSSTAARDSKGGRRLWANSPPPTKWMKLPEIFCMELIYQIVNASKIRNLVFFNGHFILYNLKKDQHNNCLMDFAEGWWRWGIIEINILPHVLMESEEQWYEIGAKPVLKAGSYKQWNAAKIFLVARGPASYG